MADSITTEDTALVKAFLGDTLRKLAGKMKQAREDGEVESYVLMTTHAEIGKSANRILALMKANDGSED